jgi:MULE transposase domain
MSNWCMEADATFRTNNLKLLLISVVGITSTERSFPGYLSFSRFDNKDTYDFLFDSSIRRRRSATSCHSCGSRKGPHRQLCGEIP